MSMPYSSIDMTSTPERRMSAMLAEPAMPYMKEMPYRMKADAMLPSTTYLKDASVDAMLFFRIPTRI